MTEGELLELAAKASGHEIDGYLYDGKMLDSVDIGGEEKCVMWNPLKDDGDALRLAVKLGISISQEKRNGCVFCDAGTFQSEVEYSGDPCAATRRAIVITAEKIGKEMKK